jgi:hypothetical protein
LTLIGRRLLTNSGLSIVFINFAPEHHGMP